MEAKNEPSPKKLLGATVRPGRELRNSFSCCILRCVLVNLHLTVFSCVKKVPFSSI